MSRILCVIDGMTDPHFQVERYGHLASMGLVRYVDTCGGFPPETLHCVLRLLGVTDLHAGERRQRPPQSLPQLPEQPACGH